MKRSFTLSMTTTISGLLLGLLLNHPAGMAGEKARTPLQQGRDLSIEFCQACHFFQGTNQAGTVGPPLIAMKPRFPDHQKLVRLIDDPHKASKPDSMMPPFGRNGLLEERQIELIIDYLYTL